MTVKKKSSTSKTPAVTKARTNKGGRPRGTTGENKLTTPTQVRCAMVQLFQQAKSGKLDTLDASRLVTILTQIQALNNIDEIEKRLAVLEDRLGTDTAYLRSA